ncbi:type I DNA topoisomerase [Trebonia sp.]|uniref:type I DNA topoisomerase n=1 Tax=Trebonia sp. TaxID=2767075 RepID=UPI00262D0365|nr:type I DNA topoisomerase [Trebonia sp.]
MPARKKAASKAAASDNGTGTGNGAARNGHGTRLVIVESPAKARTIAGYLGRGYVVESSIGHIRDMPDKAAEIPQKYRAEPWARLGVDVDNDFAALYVVPSDKKQQVSKLKTLLKDADELLLATDEDREGEAIAWHLLEELKPKVPARRMVFHEITPEAIARAVANPTELNHGKVDAYQTRRVLDRLYGYEVSPVLWKKVMPRLSAGRVQSVATRLIVDRERERIAFRSAGYWDLEAEFATAEHGRQRLPDSPTSFTATLQSVDGRRVATGRDFTPQGELRASDAHTQLLLLDGPAAAALAGRLQNADFTVSGVERKPYRRSPYPPFRTTTLQQEASRKLGFSAKYTMSVAQRLYENGYITYMRTDSITLSQTAIAAARHQARELYGAEYVPDAPRTYASKVKNAQEAHEAIRPAGDRFRTPQEAQRSGLKGDELRLYDLVWKRTVACQMKDATGESVSVKVAGTSTDNERAEFAASGKVINFFGFLKAYVESTDEANGDRDDQERRLPQLAEHDPLTVLDLHAAEHATRPPARYTEASLVKELEDREIGRPSTYASIIGTILDRGYVFKKGTALVPSFLAFAVVTLLERHFGQLVDYEFTARMEDALDEIARGEAERVPWLRRFYFGDGSNGAPAGARDRSEEKNRRGLKALVSNIGDIDARDVSSFPLAGTDIVVRVGRYGPYLERDGQRANVPQDMAPDELTPQKAEELFSQPNEQVRLGTDPVTDHVLVAKAGRFGPYVTEQLPDDSPDKPRTASLLKSMTLETVTLDDALRLLSLPRELGELDGEPVTVQNGRYGPYVKHGAESRSLPSEEEMFTVTLAEAKDLLAQPKTRGRGARAAAPPLRELGEDPATGKPMLVKDGRFGPYVTDGEINASLRKGDEVTTLTAARAAELLADRRAAPKAAAPKAAPKAAAKRTPAKKAPATRKKNETQGK